MAFWHVFSQKKPTAPLPNREKSGCKRTEEAVTYLPKTLRNCLYSSQRVT